MAKPAQYAHSAHAVTRREVIAAAGAIAGVAAAATSCEPAVAQPTPPKARYGAAVYDTELGGDGALRSLYARHCEVVTPGYFLKWESVQPSHNHFDWRNADAAVDLGRSLGAAVRGHTLVWHQSMPAWALAIASAAEAERALVSHIETIVARYKGRIHSWDVVNEPLDEAALRPEHLRRSVWQRQLGPRHLEVAFRTAAAVDPSCQLVLNEYGVETTDRRDQGKRRALLGLIRQLRERDVPIHAVGLQSHIKAEQSIDKDGLGSFLSEIKAMGLAVLITELDMMDDRLPGDISTRDEICADRTRDLLSTVFGALPPQEVITWGLSDRRTWLPTSYHKRADGLPMRPLPFDAELRPKPMWQVIENFVRPKS
jgi:endo-1,4-beta-xylanase